VPLDRDNPLLFPSCTNNLSVGVATIFSHPFLVKEGPDASYIFSNPWNIMCSQPKLVGVTDRQKHKKLGNPKSSQTSR